MTEESKFVFLKKDFIKIKRNNDLGPGGIHPQKYFIFVGPEKPQDDKEEVGSEKPQDDKMDGFRRKPKQR